MENHGGAYYPLSERETKRFRKIILDNLLKSASIEYAENCEYDGIGRLGEKQMHSALKSFICPDQNKHEIKIQNSPLYIPKTDENTKNRKYVADILDGDTIYEIQTGSFAPLRDKIKWILENTSYRVVVIHPIAETKWIRKIDNDEHGFAYRESIYSKNPHYIILAVMMELVPGKMNEIIAKMNQNVRTRKEKQPLELASAGSYFKRPEGHFAGKLIEDCGLKGFSVGGAQVSKKHAGFIVNLGSADWREVLELEKIIKERVASTFGVTLEREVRVITD